MIYFYKGMGALENGPWRTVPLVQTLPASFVAHRMQSNRLGLNTHACIGCGHIEEMGTTSEKSMCFLLLRLLPLGKPCKLLLAHPKDLKKVRIAQMQLALS